MGEYCENPRLVVEEGAKEAGGGPSYYPEVRPAVTAGVLPRRREGGGTRRVRAAGEVPAVAGRAG